MRADLINLVPYKDVNLDEDPIILLGCDHIYTVSSLDGHLELEKHYSKRAGPRQLQFTGDTLKGCPDCRHPLRDINRYNRVFKTLLLDELTRRFVTRSKEKYAKLMEDFRNMESKIELDRGRFINKAAGESADIKKLLDGYKKRTNALSKAITNYNNFVSKTEQPLMKVNGMYQSAIAQRGQSRDEVFRFDEGMIQTGVTFRARCLKVKFWWVVLHDWYYISKHNRAPQAVKVSLRDSIGSELKKIIEETNSIIKECTGTNLPVPKVEARIYRTLFSILDLENQKGKGVDVKPATESNIRAMATAELKKCQAVCDRYPGTLGHIPPLIEEALKMARGDVFYSKITSEEENMVIAAMAAEFLGAGHWYYCENRHPVG
ncbi:hypothetical protein AA313_de0201328 [Arthrobotrys entomopaga]|nr:hypothetical protein AA313_de0201328 [Arthrobotrys entomopaga]